MFLEIILLFIRKYPFLEIILDGDKHSLALCLRLGYLVDEHEQPVGGVEHHAHLLVSPDEDASLRVARKVALVDADAREAWHVDEQRQWATKLEGASHHHLVSALWYGALSHGTSLREFLGGLRLHVLHLFLLGVETVVLVDAVVVVGRFEGVAESQFLVVDVECPDGVGAARGIAYEGKFHRSPFLSDASVGGNVLACGILAVSHYHFILAVSHFILYIVHNSLLAILRFLVSGVLFSNRWCKGTAVRILIKTTGFIKMLKKK